MANQPEQGDKPPRAKVHAGGLPNHAEDIRGCVGIVAGRG